jgi:predicted unusual protein kinase regulating ubiquinone biosynthesis (AarF/ABC1/UbiB family)
MRVGTAGWPGRLLPGPQLWTFAVRKHPANIMVLADGQLALLDFGSVGHLDTQLQGALQSLLLAIGRRDPAALRDALLEITDGWGCSQPVAQARELR